MWKWRIARNAIFYSSSAFYTSPLTNLVCPSKFFHNPCTLFALGITVALWEIKDCLCKTRSIMEDVKMRILPSSFFTFLLFTKRANLTTTYKRFGKNQNRMKKRHVDNCGFYKNDKFCEIGEFGFIKGPAKILNETKKEAFLVCNHVTRRPCCGSTWLPLHRDEIGNLRKWGIGQESKGLAKTQMRWQRGQS